MRPFKHIYLSFIKYNHPILSLCNKTKDYNSKYIKASLVLISFSLYYFVNCLFITQNMIHNMYEKSDNNLGMFFPYIFISFIICYILERIIRYGSLSYDNIYSVDKENLYNNAKIRASQVRKILFWKYICFYILGFFSIFFFGYYISAFGAVYQNTQFILIKNTIKIGCLNKMTYCRICTTRQFGNQCVREWPDVRPDNRTTLLPLAACFSCVPWICGERGF